MSNTATSSAAKEAEQRLHHLYSPSSLQNREACPCYDNRSDSVNKAAADGTLQHAMTETGDDDHRLDDDQAMHVAECMDFYAKRLALFVQDRENQIAKLKEQAKASGVPDFIPPAEVLELKEVYLPIDDLTFIDQRWVSVKEKDGSVSQQLENLTTLATTAGYLDRAILTWDRRVADIIDWKFGAWAVEPAATNLQGISYLLGLFKMFPTLMEVHVHFKLPQLGSITEATFTRNQIPELYLRVQTVVARSREAHNRMIRDDFSMARPLVPACNFCANLGKCPKVAEIAIKVGQKFHPLAIPSDITPTGIKSPDDTSIGLRLAQVMATWAKAFRKQVTDRVISMKEAIPPGFKIQTRSDREIVDNDKFAEVSKQFISPEELAKCATYTFGPIEDLISEKAPRGSKKATLEEYAKALEESGAVKRGDGYTFLKAMSDKVE